MASEPLLEFDKEFKGDDWYKDSLSKILADWTHEFRHKLAPHIHRVLDDAATSVWFHESTINHLVQNAPVGEPLHPDLDFVRDGYKKALKDLIDLLKSRDGPDANHPSVEYLRPILLPLFEARFYIMDIDYGLREYYYGGSWKA
ncbi:hypothetical protein FRC08_016301 [Ceratobasidium sp. 394]|nr:hypothetical protein FRC08_016301 [Ceratobasidium sp. 394]KAG9082354.1 hypothetical protein FS749_006905 [Ceratobasidium sp. UAMH 11750]